MTLLLFQSPNEKKGFKILLLFMYRVCIAVLSVHCSLAVTCWERADLLALLCVMLTCVCHFPMWFPGSGVVLDCIES